MTAWGFAELGSRRAEVMTRVQGWSKKKKKKERYSGFLLIFELLSLRYPQYFHVCVCMCLYIYQSVSWTR